MENRGKEEERQGTEEEGKARKAQGMVAGAEEKALYASAMFAHTATTAIDSEMRNHSIINLIP